MYIKLQEFTKKIEREMKDRGEVLLFTTLAGSHVYGTNNESSDLDFRAVYLAPPEHYIGIKSHKQTYNSISEELDYTAFEFKHFLHLAINANPNVLELLFLNTSEYILGEEDNFQVELFENASSWFLSQKLYKTYVGYATSQYSKILGETTGKMGEKRKDLLKKYGYETKMASHAIRLLKTLNFFLETGVFRTKPPERVIRLLNAIKIGEMDEDEFIASYRSNLKYTNDLWENKNKNIPAEPNYEEVNQYAMRVFRRYLKI